MDIFEAAAAGDVEATNKILKADRKVVSARNFRKQQPLHIAAMHGHLLIVRVLLAAKAKVSVKDEFGVTAAGYAAVFNQREVFDTLRAKGADGSGFALHGAAAEGNVEAARLLLEAGADPSLQAKNGPAPLHNVANHASFDRLEDFRAIAKMLIAAGAELEAIDDNGFTPLLQACLRGNTEIAEMLLDGGADIESRGQTDSTPLLVAVGAARLAALRMLLKRGADPSAYNADERDALEEATFHRHRFIAELIAKYTGAKAKPLSGKASSAELAMAVQFSDLADIRHMLGAEPELLPKPSSFGMTTSNALEVAAYFGRESAASLLLERGADPQDSGDKYGTHPMHTAARWNHASIIALLVRAGADVNPRQNTNGWTPLHYAADMAAVDAVRALLEAKANPAAKDKKAQTPLEVARNRMRTSNPQGYEDPAELRRLNQQYDKVESLLKSATA